MYLNDYEIRYQFKQDFRKDMPLETMKIKYNVEDIKQTCIDNINEHDLRERKVSRVVKLRRLGLYFHEIAKETGWDESTIKKYYHESRLER